MRHGKTDRLDPASLSSNPRATLAQWLRFKPIVEAAMSVQPNIYTYRPTSMKTTTVATRIRDAIRGAIALNHYNDEEKTKKLLAWYREVVVRAVGDAITIGPETAAAPSPIEGSDDTTPYSFATLSFEETAAFCTLLNTGRIVGPVSIKTPPNPDLLGVYPNVQFIERTDGSLVLI